MRTLEILIVLIELAVLLVVVLKPIPDLRNARWLLLLPLSLSLLHGLVEGTRWQMVPAYGIALTLALTFLASPTLHLPRHLKVILSSLGSLLVALSLLLGYLLPVFQLPKPSGSFAVGTTYWHLQDSTRSEPITDDPNDVRELMVRVWYPAQAEHQSTYSYMHPELTKVLARNRGLPAFMLSHFALIETHALENAPVALEIESFPVIIFSPGYTSHSSMYTSLTETLASHGYIVFGIDYTYETPLSIFPDDDLRFLNPEYTDIWKNTSWDDVQASIVAFRETSDTTAQRQYVSQYLTQVPYTARVNSWTEDVHFVIGELQNKANQYDQLFFRKIDQDNIGVMGHSVGGATSAVACALDSRIKAGINLDGSQWGNLLDHAIIQPFLWITAEKDLSASSADIDSFIYSQVSEGDFYHLSIGNATHTNFSDLSLWSNYTPLTQTGSIDSHRAIEIINQCSVNFFDKYLKERPNTIDEITEKFDELSSKNW
ncbi:alpha/beta hydrolase family protein [Tunicatimonas pelagia]|uniref:alpha/beta hydrolase family protein n=1 Tax=Tunicatimonas pelagia TaxID=931531 RepID=UPI0026665DD2|nr:hypothetical protein [Tunicatimonas pelagia]WKN42127.1 hypothetical protein P0M28_24125 [Tunicatimonas pelagia]